MISVATAHVVLLLAVSADPSAATVSRAAVDALAAPFTEPPRVVLRSLAAAPTPARVSALAREAEADAVVILTCAGDGCAIAEVGIANNGGKPATRTVRFGPRDDLVERGRAIGLLASTFLPDDWSRSHPPVAAAAATPARAGPSGVTVISTAGATGPPARPARWGIDTTGAFLTSMSGGADLGLTVAATRIVSGGLAIRAGLKLELGDLPGNGGSLRAVGGLAGLAWTSAGLAQSHHFGWGARADVIAVGRQVRRNASMLEADDNRTDLALGGDAVALVGFALSPAAVLLASAGVEVLGSIAAQTGDDAMLFGNPPAFRLLGELGILARF